MADCPDLLILAALEEEVAPFLDKTKASAATPLAADAIWWRGKWKGQAIHLLSTGMGPKRAGASLDAYLAFHRPRIILITGYCGALDPSLRVGQWAAGTELAGPTRFPLGPPMTSIAPDAALGTVASTGAFIHRPSDKRALLKSAGAIAVDMESGAWAERLAADDVAPAWLKVVTDRTDDRLPDLESWWRQEKAWQQPLWWPMRPLETLRALQLVLQVRRARRVIRRDAARILDELVLRSGA